MENGNLETVSTSTDSPDLEENEKKYRYKKRSGTSGVTGQLYETKLLSLVLFRILKNKGIQEFYLGTNLEDIGAFDDICIKFQTENKWVAAFIQVKHRDDPRKSAITDSDLRHNKSDFNLQKYFDSYIKIKEQFKNINQTDKMFTEDTECYFIIYTPAASKISKKKVIPSNTHVRKIRDMITTSIAEDVFRIRYDDSDINLLTDGLIEEQLTLISKALLDCIVTDTNNNTTEATFKIIKKYRSFLIPNVIEICQEGDSCEAKVNEKFLYSNNSLHIELREILCNELLMTSVDNKECEMNLGAMLIPHYFDIKYLIKIVGKIVIFNRKSNKLEMRAKVSDKCERYRAELKKFPISTTTILEAYHEAGKNALLPVRFKLPEIKQHYEGVIEAESIVMNDKLPSGDSDVFEEQKNVARQFYDRLFFFTNEAKQEGVEKVLKKELHDHNKSNTKEQNLLKVHADVIFLKFHDKVQKWWMLQGNVHYLIKSCKLVDDSKNEVLSYPFLSVLNFYFTNELKKYDIKYRDETVKKMIEQLDSFSLQTTTIFSKDKFLTCMKLVQCLNKMEFLYNFINLEHAINLSSGEFQTLLEELQSTALDYIIVFYETHKQDEICDTLNHIVEQFPRKIIVVTDQILSKDFNLKANCNVVVDRDNNLVDLTDESQKQLFASKEITIQGLKVPLNSFLYDEYKYLFNTEILVMLLKSEPISIGKNLSDEKYESMKNFYIERCFKKEREVKDLKDFKCSVVVLTAEPGMGKSTLLSHLSIETKKNYPSFWIARINLLDYCSEFLKWQNDRREISLLDTMTLVCKAELGNVEGTFELKITDGVVALKSCNITGSALFCLKLIILNYNNGTIIFLFDGFDEICPHYEKEVVQLIKNVVPEHPLIRKSDPYDSNDIYNRYGDESYIYDWFTSDNDWDKESCNGTNSEMKSSADLMKETKNLRIKVWIASRPYNSIKMTLELEFGQAYQLEPWHSGQQELYCDKYFEANIKLHELSTEQFANIENFFRFMSQFRREYKQDYKVLHVTNIPLHTVYGAAVNYFRNAILQAPLDVDKKKLRSEWVAKTDLLSTIERCLGNLFEIGGAMRLAGIPLHIHIAADHFINEIKAVDEQDVDQKWDLDANTFAYYERFLETKFKTIALEEKNRRYTSCPAERIAYEKEKKEFIENHKRLAFYSLFHGYEYYFRKIISENEETVIKDLIKKIERGEEKIGLIHRIHAEIPMFVHLVFAEYFAFEFISDKLKIVDNDTKEELLSFILNSLLIHESVGIMTVFDQKLLYDNDLYRALTDAESKRCMFELLLKQKDLTKTVASEFDTYGYHEEKIECCLVKALGNGLSNVAKLLLSGIEDNLNEDNLEIFVELIGESFFITAGLINDDNTILTVLNKIRTIDAKTVEKVIKKSDLPYYFKLPGGLPSNEELLQEIYSKVKDLTTPYWYYDDEDHTYYPLNF